MLVVKTVRIPVHYGITKHKLSILDSLTARTTCGVWLWSKLFKEHALKGSYTDRHLFDEHVKQQAELSGAMAQCCFDTASWLWRSYREVHKVWRRRVTFADFNSGINIGSRFLPKATTRQATDDLAHARNEQAREIVACEPRSTHPFMGGS